MTVQVLVSSRDAGAAHHLVEVILAGKTDLRYRFTVVAQEPAYTIFSQSEIQCELIDLPCAQVRGGKEEQDLLDRARYIFNEQNYDVLLAGLSTHIDGGIDEALISLCEIPSFVMQDFWGEVNRFFDKSAGLYFCIDEDAVRLTKKLHGCEAIMVGSPKYVRYQDIDFPAMRINARDMLGFQEETFALGYFGQPFSFLPGYYNLIQDFADQLREIEKPIELLYRPHPRETPKDREATIRILEETTNQKIIDIGYLSVEESLVACDVVSAVFSNTLYDLLFINYFSPVPISSPISLLFEKSVADFCYGQLENNEAIGPLRSGMIDVVNDVVELSAILDLVLKEDKQMLTWQNAKKLPSPENSIKIILDTLYAAGSTTMGKLDIHQLVQKPRGVL